jgi:hypothetical protein
VRVCVCVCIYMRVYIHIYIHIHTHAYIHTYIHACIHTYIGWSSGGFWTFLVLLMCVCVTRNKKLVPFPAVIEGLICARIIDIFQLKLNTPRGCPPSSAICVSICTFVPVKQENRIGLLIYFQFTIAYPQGVSTCRVCISASVLVLLYQ